MQATSAPRESVRQDTTVIDVERFAILRELSPAVRDLSSGGHVFLRDHRKLKWVLVMLTASLSFQSYFVRQLLAALFFFTILYVILAALVALYILFDHALYSGFLWVASLGHSFHLFLHSHLALPGRVLSLPNRPTSEADQRLGRALAPAVTILFPERSPGTALALHSALQIGRSPCPELHYLAGGQARGDGQKRSGCD